MSNTGSAVATITSGANTPNPTIVFDSSGNFYIVATVSPSLNLNYAGTTLTSLQITVYTDTPNIEFSSLVTSQSPYAYKFENSYEFTGGAATVTNNTGQPTGQTLIYQIVTADSTTASLTPSTVATIDPTGWFLNTVSCGTTGTSTFRICATADASGDYGYNVALSDVLTIEKATPIINQYPQIILPQGVTASTLVYGQPYTITPDPSQISTITSNTDTNPYPNINYTSSDPNIATISGITVTLVKVGHFQIMTGVSYTTNYNEIPPSPSTQIYDIIQAVPTIQNFITTALSAQTWVFGQPYPGIIPPPSSISTTNTDGPLITYSTSDSTIATISGNTINITGVGNFQILVTIALTTNFSAVTYSYPSGLVYTNPAATGVTYTSYNAGPATPIITFPLPPTFVTSATFGSTYVFVPPTLTNNDPSQTLTYSIVNSNPVVASTTPVATLVPNPQSPTSNPSVVINSTGTFQIQASCGPSTNGYYSATPLNPLSPILSPTIRISLEMPIIVFIPFNTTYFFSQYTCQPSSPYSLSGTIPIASITNNKVQKLTYSIVAIDGVTPSTIATISSDGTSLTTNSVGYFQILATPTDPNALTTGDYGGNTLASETIQIISATPTITTFPTIPSTFIYGNTYPIPYTTSPPYTITTSNTDTAPGPSITYSSTNTAVATISGSIGYSSNSAISSITGTTITIQGVGNFQILVTIGATINYNPVTYTYPSPTTYYTTIQATPTISPFPSNFGSGWVFGGSYDLTSPSSVTVTTNAGSGYTDPNSVTYSIINQSVSNNAVITTSGISSISSSGFSQQITINDVVSFQIQADLAVTTNFTAAAPVQSNTITISPSTVALIYNFSGYVYGGGPYTLPSNPTNNTDTNPPPTITYTGFNGNGTISGNTITFTSSGGGYISFTVSATENFNATSFSVMVTVAPAAQVVVCANTQWIGPNFSNFCIGAPPINIGNNSGYYPLILSNNNPNPYYGLTSFNPDVATISWNGYNYQVNPVSPGSFQINILAQSSGNYSQTTVSTQTIYVCVLPEIIIFNNPQVWPPQNNVGGEYGLVIGLPPYDYPFGFNDYSALTITNTDYNNTFTLTAYTTPTFNSVLNKYMVFFDPYTTGNYGDLGLVLSTTTAGNIGLVQDASIAYNDNSQNIIFNFVGLPNNYTGLAPSSLTITWTTVNLIIQPGQVYGSYYSIAPGVAPFNFTIPSDMTVNNGNYTVGWSGYPASINIPAYQAWGVPTNNTTYASFSPLISNGNFYPPAPTTSSSGGVITFYQGIPKILYPNY